MIVALPRGAAPHEHEARRHRPAAPAHASALAGAPARHRLLRPRHPHADPVRRAHRPPDRLRSDERHGRRRHGDRTRLRLLRRLGRHGHHADRRPLLRVPVLRPGDRHRRHARPQHLQHVRRDLGHELDQLRPHYARAHAGGQTPGVHAGRPRARLQEPPRDVQAHPAERRLVRDHLRDGRRRRQHRARFVARVPRPRRTAAVVGVGGHDLGRPELPPHRLVALDLPGHRHHPRRRRVQPDRRRPRGHPQAG